MGETYIKVKGKWIYLYSAIDKHGDTIEFMLSAARDETAHLIRKGQLNQEGVPAYRQFMALAG